MAKKYVALVGISIDLPKRRFEAGDVVSGLSAETMRALLSIDPPVLEEVKTEVSNGEPREE